MNKIIIIVFLIVGLSSCATLDVYEKQIPFPQHEWSSKTKPTFNFTIQDTTSAYNFFVVLRHTDAYQFQNIWLNITVKFPDSTYTVKREFMLANNTQWLGSSIDDVVEHRLSFNNLPIHLKKGNYQFTLEQIMREDPLQNFLNAGIRVEKVQP
jgi:gliding motility-associated lipoprotein GldH